MGRSSGLYLDEELFTFAEKRAAEQFKGKLNAYIVSLVEKDRAFNFTASNGAFNVIVDLARAFQPAHAKALEQQLLMLEPPTTNNPVQPRIIARFLLALHEAMKREEFDPSEPFQLWPSETVLMNTILGNDALLEYIQSGKSPLMKAAENKQASYGAKPRRPKKGQPGATAHLPKSGEQPGSGAAASA